MSFVSASTGWVWGPGGCCAEQGYGPGTLAKTTDGGTSWQTVATRGIDYGQYGEPITTGATGVRFVDDRRGYLFGDQLFVTSDGGVSWQQHTAPGPVEDVEDAAGAVYALVRDCPTASACWAAQTATDRLYEISDGTTFTLVGPPDPVSELSQLITHGSSVFLLAPDTTVPGPTMLWTELPDGSWQQRGTPCGWSGADFGAMAAWSATGLALVCGSEPSAGNQLKTAYVSTDTGRHWQEVAPLADSSGYVADLAASDARTWVLGEARGGMLVTHNGGHSWQPAAFTGTQPSVEGWVGVTFVSATQAVASPWTLNGSALAITTDTAHSWESITFPSGR